MRAGCRQRKQRPGVCAAPLPGLHLLLQAWECCKPFRLVQRQLLYEQLEGGATPEPQEDVGVLQRNARVTAKADTQELRACSSQRSLRTWIEFGMSFPTVTWPQSAQVQWLYHADQLGCCPKGGSKPPYSHVHLP